MNAREQQVADATGTIEKLGALSPVEKAKLLAAMELVQLVSVDTRDEILSVADLAPARDGESPFARDDYGTLIPRIGPRR